MITKLLIFAIAANLQATAPKEIVQKVKLKKKIKAIRKGKATTINTFW